MTLVESRKLRILFVGETWKGSSARSLREGLSLIPEIYMDEIGEDHFMPKGRSFVIRGANRVLRPWYQAALTEELSRKISVFNPDVLIVYKGSLVTRDVVHLVKSTGVFTVNIFPDCSPNAYGRQLHQAMGEYDLVISTKPFHPPSWSTIYGYENPCVVVPHGYDPEVHYWDYPPAQQDIDLIMVANWRPQYEQTLLDLSKELDTQNLIVLVAGLGWEINRQKLPPHWKFMSAVHGRAYGDLLRRGKIIVAPVHREVVINGHKQPGDEDTTRTYELAAMNCFFLHRRTPFVQTIYSEVDEVPMWDDAIELAGLIRKYLPLDTIRKQMAYAAHRRAVPAYAIPSRAKEVFEYVKTFMSGVARR